MFGWGEKTDKGKLLNYKKVKILGSSFVIRPVNVLLDFPQDKMPQIFTDFSRRNYSLDDKNPKVIQRLQEDMRAVVKAGLVSPSEADGITVDDLARDTELLHKLYLEIIEHSLLRFRGLNKCFFLVLKTLLWPTVWLKSIHARRARSSSETALV